MRAINIAITVAVLLLPWTTAEAKDWNRRWRLAEKHLTEPDLSAVAIGLTDDLVVVSEPFVASHCDPEPLVEQGSVTAFSRLDGVYQWKIAIPQASQDQSAFLVVFRVGAVLVFATNGIMTAVDPQGRISWQREVGTAVGGCTDTVPWRERQVTQHGSHVAWIEGDTDVCSVDLKTGRTSMNPTLLLRNAKRSVKAVLSAQFGKRRFPPKQPLSGKRKEDVWPLAGVRDSVGTASVTADCINGWDHCKVRISHTMNK